MFVKGHLPDTDTHIFIAGADGSDTTLHLAAPFTRAGGGLDITEHAQP